MLRDVGSLEAKKIAKGAKIYVPGLESILLNPISRNIVFWF